MVKEATAAELKKAIAAAVTERLAEAGPLAALQEEVEAARAAMREGLPARVEDARAEARAAPRGRG